MIAPYSEDFSHLEQVVEIAHEAVITIDSDLRIVAFNRRAEQMFGYRRREVLDTSLNRLIPSSLSANHTRLVRQFLRRGPQDRAMAPRRSVRAKDAHGREFEVLITIYSTGVGESAIATAVIVDPSERRDNAKTLRLLLEQNRRNGRQLIKRENEYRRTLAHMIHNDLAQEAVSIAVTLDMARQRLADEPDVLEELFGRIEGATRRIHDVVDQLLNHTRPPVLDRLSLPGAVDDCITRLGIRESGVTVETSVDPLVKRLADPAMSITYRIIQEAMTNAMRHAWPGLSKIHADISVSPRSEDPAWLKIRVEDDGACSEQPDNPYGVGLKQISEWCLAMGGEFRTGTSSFGGFCLEVGFPVEDQLS